MKVERLEKRTTPSAEDPFPQPTGEHFYRFSFDPLLEFSPRDVEAASVEELPAAIARALSSRAEQLQEEGRLLLAAVTAADVERDDEYVPKTETVAKLVRSLMNEIWSHGMATGELAQLLEEPSAALAEPGGEEGGETTGEEPGGSERAAPEEASGLLREIREADPTEADKLEAQIREVHRTRKWRRHAEHEANEMRRLIEAAERLQRNGDLFGHFVEAFGMVAGILEANEEAELKRSEEASGGAA